ncbi:type 4a pilus biogenesis protein PilO [Patescibacteria group bacterium]|nr:type 4a pilus biogenesis protein PilO [Patescibacteria group bacterium]
MTRPNFLKYLTPKAIINLSLIVGFLTFAIFTLFSLGNEVEERSSLLRAQRATIDSRTNMISRLAELRKTSVEAQSAMEVLRGALPPKAELFSFSDYLKEVGAKNDVGVEFSFTGGETLSSPDNAGYNPFRIVNNGSLNNISSFIQNIEDSNKFLVRITSVDVSQVKDTFKSTIEGLVFFYD